MSLILPLALSFVAPTAVYHRPLRTFTPDAFGALHAKLYQAQPIEPTGLDVLKISYHSPHSPAPFRRLSGALFLPTGRTIKGTVLYCHGTITTRDAVGSRLPDHALGWAAGCVGEGFAVVMPDYIGLGDSKVAHPYPLSRINAWSSLDMIQPAQQVGRRIGRNLPQPLFVGGYSEGGSIAMWAARLAQENPNLGIRFRAAAPQSGPYDLSGTTAKSLVSPQSNPVYLAARQMLAGYIGYSTVQWVRGVRYQDLFVPSFASYVPLVFKTAKTDEEVAKRLALKSFQIRPGANSIRPILQPRLVRAMERRDLRHPVIKALAAHDGYAWKPTLPMKLLAIEKDYLVDPENTRKAYRTMRQMGVPASRLSMEIVPGDLNHVSAEVPLSKMAAEWFTTFLEP